MQNDWLNTMKFTADRFLRLPEVMRLTGLSKATIYRGMRDGKFPRNTRLSTRCVGWSSTAVYAWMERRLE